LPRPEANFRAAQQSAQRKALVRLDRDAGAGLLKINISEDYTPTRTFAVDYCHVSPSLDGIRMLFGKKSPFSTDQVLKFHFLIDITFPHAAFVNQLYKSLLTPSDPKKPLFGESVKQSVDKNGYAVIEQMPPPSVADSTVEPKLGSGRGTLALMHIFDDEASVDFLHLDAMTLHMASQGKPIRADKVGQESVRFIMAPNVLQYLLKLVEQVAKDLMQTTPGINRDTGAV
jgi:hypothetical protein